MSSLMDKSWIKSWKGSEEYMIGVFKFIEFASKQVDFAGKIYCPCKHCFNHRKFSVSDVQGHLFKYGIWPVYEVWTKHGEEDIITVNARNEDHVMSCVMDDLRPTVEIGGQSGDIEMGDDHSNGTGRGSFDALFKELETDLYPGFTKMSSLDFIAKLMHVKVKNKWTNTSFTELLELLGRVMPEGHNLPASYAECNRKLQSLGMGYTTIDVCLNDCALYYKENEKLEKCPVCGESRWDLKKGKKVAHKKLRYFPIAPRLQRMFASRHTAKDMIWHHTGKSTDEDVLRHPVDGQSWKAFDERHPEFASEPRNVRLGLGIDGFCPFSMQNNSYSMWPVILTIYNLPPWLCMKESTFMLTLLIPGPRSPGKDMDVFLRPIVDELETLWGTGIVTWDAHLKEEFVMKVSLLHTTNDYPARSYTSGWSGQGYLACPECMIYTPSVRVKK